MTRRVRIIVWLGVGAVVLVAAVFALRLVLAQEPRARPELPSSLQPLRDQWSLPIVLPADLPDCFVYPTSGGAIVDDQDARDGKALSIRIEARAAPECQDLGLRDLELRQATALYSLRGQVTTVSYDRLQFARVAHGNGSDQSRVTLQWRCAGLMCRINATVDRPEAEETLLRIAASAQRTR